MATEIEYEVEEREAPRVWTPQGIIKLQRRPPTGEIGASGYAIQGGVLGETDYNLDLQGNLLYETIDKMRLADPQIKAALNVVKLPLGSAEYSIEPGSDQSRDEEIAEFVADNLFGMTVSWPVHFNQAMLSFDYGAAPFEKVWELKDQRVRLRKLALRKPSSILKWLLDDTGGLAGIEQQVIKTEGSSIRTIPVEKLLVFVHDLEGSNYRGISLLRAAYRSWFYKDMLLRVDAIQKEKRGLGVDVGTLMTEDAGKLKKLESALMSLHAHEKQYFAEVEGGWKYRVEGVKGAIADPLPSIKYHDLEMVKSVLADFLTMTEEGSLAMHKDKSSLFIMALKMRAGILTDTYNRHLIPQLVDFNFADVKEYPRLVHSRLDTRPILEVAKAVAGLVEVAALTPDDGMEESLRRDLELPEREEAPDVEARRHFAQHPDRRRRRRRSRPRTEYEKRVNFELLEKSLDSAEADVLAAVRVVARRQIENLVEFARKAFEGGDVRVLEDAKVRFQSEAAAPIREVLGDLYDVGRTEASRELREQGLSSRLQAEGLDPASRREVAAFFGSKGRALAGLMADKLLSGFLYETLTQFREGAFNEGRLSAQLFGLSDREIKKAAGQSVTEALNLGRQAIAQINDDDIDHTVFSALLDGGTCVPCEAADGKQVKFGTNAFEAFRPPYRQCEGRGRCRCIYVFVLKTESSASA